MGYIYVKHNRLSIKPVCYEGYLTKETITFSFLNEKEYVGVIVTTGQVCTKTEEEELPDVSHIVAEDQEVKHTRLQLEAKVEDEVQEKVKGIELEYSTVLIWAITTTSKSMLVW